MHPTDEYLIALASSSDRHWPWTSTANAEQVFAATHPSVYEFFTTDQTDGENRLERMKSRQDQGVHWWELRRCTYYDHFDQPKTVFTDIAWQPEVALDRAGLFLNNSAYFVPSDDPWTVAVLNSPTVWWLAWRTFQHGKDEALRWFAASVETLPFPEADSQARDAVATAVPELRRLSVSDTEQNTEFVAWLHTRFDVRKANTPLDDSAALGTDGFLALVQRWSMAGDLSPAGVGELTRQHARLVNEFESRAMRRHVLEVDVARAVDDGFSLSSEQRELIRATAPPRTPLYSAE